MKPRQEIEEEIRKRHDTLLGRMTDEGPPAVGTGASPMPVARWLEDVLSRRVSMPADVSEDEPPPSRS